jgi:hypothetical protein
VSISTLIPVPSDDVTASALAPRLRSLDGATVGILFNAKPNASSLLTAIADLLCKKFSIEAVLTPVRTEGVYHPSTEQLTLLASQADLVLIGLGDCGSCSACSIQVATQFERLGVPAAAICTTPFLSAGKAVAARQGMPGYEFATVAHPLSSLTMDELRERAREALPQVLSILGVTAALDLQDREGALTGA